MNRQEAENAFAEAERRDKKYIELHAKYKTETTTAGIKSDEIRIRPTLLDLYHKAFLSLQGKQFDEALAEFSDTGTYKAPPTPFGPVQVDLDQGLAMLYCIIS